MIDAIKPFSSVKSKEGEMSQNTAMYQHPAALMDVQTQQPIQITYVVPHPPKRAWKRNLSFGAIVIIALIVTRLLFKYGLYWSRANSNEENERAEKLSKNL